jgi:PST family polysaccharide transporter
MIKIVDNVSWLFIDKVLRMLVGLFIGIWIARYLGPKDFGLLSYSIAFAGLFGVIAALGLRGIVVRDIVQDKKSAELTLGTAGIFHIFGGLVSFLLLIVTIAYLRPDDILARTVVSIIGLRMILKASDIVLYWFASQLQSKYTVLVQSSVLLLFAVVKVILILQHASLVTFAWILTLESLFVSLMLFIVMERRGLSIISLRSSLKKGAYLLSNCWPLVLSSIAITLYMKIDQVMLGEMIGDEAVGIYSVAVRMSEIWYFIPIIIGASVFPSLLEAKKISEEKYYARIQKLFDLMVWISIIIAVPMTFFSVPLIIILFGESYASGGVVLGIHIWAAVFAFLSSVSGKWFIAEGKQLLSLQRNLLGAAVNVILNLYLIPAYGAVGAAVATLFSHAIAGVFADILQKQTRKIFYMKLGSLNLFYSLARLYR